VGKLTLYQRTRKKMKDKQVIIFGGSGQTGTAVFNELLKNGYSENHIHLIPWSIMGRSEICLNKESLRNKLFSEVDSKISSDFIFASGITDPLVAEEKINYSNIEFPKRVIEATFDHSDFRYLTLGSFQENDQLFYKNNKYLKSKLELGNWIVKKSQKSNGKNRFLHLRLHTLYGGKPKEHMFLGQITNAIKNETVFRMTSGLQLREYHHVDDIAVTIRSILERDWSFGPVVEINSGKPVRLAKLAKDIFKAFRKENLLEIGAIPTPTGENMEKVFQRSEEWLISNSRPSIRGVIESLKQYLKT